MKKSLILILISISSFSWANDIYSGLNDSQRIQLKKRLTKFGLFERRERRNQRAAAQTSNVINKLLADLNGAYFRASQDALGSCSGGDCLSREDGRATFRDAYENSHCYPNTTCEYYKCMEEQYRCMNVGVEYFENLAYPTCQAYMSNIEKNKFGPKGREWIYTVMVCLQKGLFEECSIRGNCPVTENNQRTCEHITEFTLKFHPSCYINSGVGVCKLPLRDQVNIWKTVGPFLTEREKQEAYKVVKHCLFGTKI